MLDAEAEFWHFVEESFLLDSDGDFIRSLDVNLNKKDESLKQIIGRFAADLLMHLDKIEIWELCSLLIGQPCGDDSFAAFRRWVILTGQGNFKKIINNPDDFYEIIDGNPQNLVANQILIENLGGLENYMRLSNSDGLYVSGAQPSWSWHDSSVDTIRNRMPRLWSIFGEKFHWKIEDYSEIANSCLIEGVGLIKKGMRLRHTKGLGECLVEEISLPESGGCILNFGGDKRNMRITADCFEIIN